MPGAWPGWQAGHSGADTNGAALTGPVPPIRVAMLIPMAVVAAATV
jgi:hypothetical protein